MHLSRLGLEYLMMLKDINNTGAQTEQNTNYLTIVLRTHSKINVHKKSGKTYTKLLTVFIPESG